MANASYSASRFLASFIGCSCLLLAAGCADRGADADPAAVVEPTPPAAPRETVRLDDPSLLAGIPGDGPLTAVAQPLSAAARRGEQLFFGNRAWCSACHNGVNFTDEQFHNIGVGLDGPNPDLGRFLVTGRDADWAAFKTPTIRNVAATAPYMHDGSLPTLAAVVDWYAQGGWPNRNLDFRFSWLEPGSLSSQDKADLVAFIEACSGPLPQVEAGRLPE